LAPRQATILPESLKFAGISSPFEAVTRHLSFLNQKATAPSHTPLVWQGRFQREWWELRTTILMLVRATTHRQLLEFPHHLRQLLDPLLPQPGGNCPLSQTIGVARQLAEGMVGTCANHFGTELGHDGGELLEFPHRLRQLLEVSPSSSGRQLPCLMHHRCGKAGSTGNGGEMYTIILAPRRATTHRELLEFPHRLRQLPEASPSSSRRQLPRIMHH